MTLEQFTQKIDGSINDYRDGASTEKEFRDAILEIMLEAAESKLQSGGCEGCVRKPLNPHTQQIHVICVREEVLIFTSQTSRGMRDE